MSDLVPLAALVAGCYALGCIVGAYYLVRWRTGTDLRTLGSGNAGARNAARVLGRAGFIASLVVDAGKGALAVWIGSRMGMQPLATVLAMTAVVAGHIWPVQLGLRGGKGAATALGLMLVFDPIASLVAFGAGIAILAATRRFTISGLAAIALAPAIVAWHGHGALEVAGVTTVAVIVVWAHRSNLPAFRSIRGDSPPVLHQETNR